MNTLRHGLLLATAFLIVQAEARTWTDRRGRTVEAELIEAQDGSAVLQKADGKKFTIKLSDLILADRRYVSENKPAAPATESPDQAKKTFGFASVSLNGSAKSHPSDAKQRTQDLVISFTDARRSADAYTLRVAFASGDPNGEISPMAFRAAAGKGGFSNGHASYSMSKDQLNITELTIPIPRYSQLTFIGYQIEILDGTTVLDTHYWENGPLLETIAKKLSLDKDWWHRGVFE